LLTVKQQNFERLWHFEIIHKKVKSNYQNEEWRWHVRVDGEEQGQGRDRFLSSTQVGHRLENCSILIITG